MDALTHPSPASSIAPWPFSNPAQAARLVQRGRTHGGLAPYVLQRVREFVDRHIEESISIEVLAGIAGLSMYHFARAFKHTEGITPHAYLLRRRVHYVQNLLVETDLPLSEIARAAGFADQSHCTRRFREHIGMTPGEYRWSTRSA